MPHPSPDASLSSSKPFRGLLESHTTTELDWRPTDTELWNCRPRAVWEGHDVGLWGQGKFRNRNRCISCPTNFGGRLAGTAHVSWLTERVRSGHTIDPLVEAPKR